MTDIQIDGYNKICTLKILKIVRTIDQLVYFIT